MKTKFCLTLATALLALTAFSYGQAGDDMKKAADDTGSATKKAAVKTGHATKKAAVKKQTVAEKVTATMPTHEDIALLALQYWAERGRQHGQDQADWLRAEQELMKMAS